MSLTTRITRALRITSDDTPPAHVVRRWATCWLTVRNVAQGGGSDAQIAAAVRILADDT